MTASWLIGVLLACTSNPVGGLSNLALRKSWLIQDGKWLRYLGLGVILAVIPVLEVAAMAFASPSILAPFSGLGLAMVFLLSKPLLGEPPDPIQVLAACLIIVGEIVVALFGDHNSHGGDELTLNEIRDSYWKEPTFLKYLLLAFLFECGIIYVMLYSTNPHWKQFAWGVGGGFLAGFQNFIKDSIAIIHQSYIALGSLAIMAECYRRYDATYSAGSFAGSVNVSAAIMSALHYHTFAHLNKPCNYILYPLGLSILLVGVGLLMHHSSNSNVGASDLDFNSNSASTSDSNSERGDPEEPLLSNSARGDLEESLLSTTS